jgi:hypothetical protein
MRLGHTLLQAGIIKADGNKYAIIVADEHKYVITMHNEHKIQKPRVRRLLHTEPDLSEELN